MATDEEMRELHHFETEEENALLKRMLTMPVSNAEVIRATKVYKAPRMHVNDTQNDREIDLRAVLEDFMFRRGELNGS